VIGFLLGLMLLGLIAGAIARLIVPGRDPMGILGTMALGIVGSFVGGFLGALLFDGELALSTTSLLGSIIGAVIALLIYRQMNARTA
jgi:uncharacterized membrane protein YeaQ/YmgE (transglycosylase-associated protein family)